MDALEFLLNAQRYCNSDSEAIDKLKGFYLGKDRTKLDFEIMIAEVEKWAKDYPVKTRQSEFLKMYPEAYIDDDGVIAICPAFVSKKYVNNGGVCTNGYRCSDCRRVYWSQKVE